MKYQQFDLNSSLQADNNARSNAKVGDTIKLRNEIYQVIGTRESKQYDLRRVTAKVVKKNGELGKKTMRIVPEFCDSANMFVTEVKIHTKRTEIY
jgi:hypothetical protein